MFKQILIPLDGSKLAEAALPAARVLADLSGAQVTLVHVIEEYAPSTHHGERHLISPDEAEHYLAGISDLAAPPGSHVSWHVHTAATGNVAQSIVAHQDELAPDLVVMCTHGRGGIRRIMIGSIAQQVVASGSTPVLLIRPNGHDPRGSFAITTVLAPIDGERAHEQGLHAAAELARMARARLRLLSVLPTMGTLAGRDATMGKFMPGTTQALLDLARNDLRSYLTRHVSRLQKTGLKVSAELREGDAPPAIAAAAESVDASIVALATHGKAGNEAFWTNSVAARVQAQTSRPLLLVPLKKDSESGN